MANEADRTIAPTSKTARFWLQQRGHWHHGQPESWISNMSAGFVHLDDALDELDRTRAGMSAESLNPFRVLDVVTGEAVERAGGRAGHVRLSMVLPC